MDAELSKDLSNDELRLLGEAIDSSPSPLTLYDANYRVIYANATSRNLWPELHKEFSKGVGLEIAAREASKVLFPGAPDDVIKAATDYVLYTFKSPEAHEMKACEGRWVRLTHHEIGKRAVAGIGVDITGMKKHEKDLQKAKRAQENLIEVLDYGLLVVDDDGFISTFNPAYQEYCNSFGFSVHHGMPVKDLTHNFIKSEKHDLGVVNFDEWFDEFYANRFGTDKDFKEEFSLSDGRHILRHQRYRKLVGNIITITDITEIKRAQIQAELAEKSKSEFLANMSHEIRTPMNGVMGMTQLLSQCDLRDKERDFVNIIQRSSVALLTIINDILDFSKIEARHVTLEKAPFNLRDCIEDVIALLSMTAAKKNVELIFHIQPDLPEIYMGDAGRLRQVITNIFGNAVKFTHEGHVFISIDGDSDGDLANLTIKIEDTGIGIPNDKIDQIFNKFQQADGSSTRKYEGAGLGLSIAKQLVNLMGGNITANSVLDQGSKFEISLALPVAEQQKGGDVDVKFLSGSNILIIDDNPLNCRVLKEQFTHWKCKSAAVNSTRQGFLALDLALKRNIRFDLIILDYQMPVMTSEDFVEKIRAHARANDIPIIVFASVAESGVTRKIRGKGRFKYLTKPYNKAALLSAAQKLVSNSTGIETDVIRSISQSSDIGENQIQSGLITNHPKSQNIDILVAEDNEVNRLYIQYVLDELGVSYKIVNDGQLAVDEFEQMSPRLILMDISMPVLNGYQATEKIRAIEKRDGLNPTPIIAITAHAMEGIREKCLKSDIDGFLTKPLAIEALKEKLIKWDILSPEFAKKFAE